MFVQATGPLSPHDLEKSPQTLELEFSEWENDQTTMLLMVNSGFNHPTIMVNSG